MEKSEVYQILGRAYFSEDCHEKEALAHLPELLDGTRLFVDIGASLGQYTLHANRALHTAEIVAVEADPVRYEELARNCQAWAAETGNKLTPVHAAACAARGEVAFYSTGSNYSGALRARDLGPDVHWHALRVLAVTLDELLAGRVPGLVKIDVEGAEYDVLRGAAALLRKRSTRFLIELHDETTSAGEPVPAAVRRLMHTAGYREEPFFGQSLFVPHASVNRAFGAAARLYRQLRRRLRGLFGSCGTRDAA